MNLERQGEIARAIVKAIAKHKGPEQMLEAVGKLDKVAQATEIELEDIKTFTEILIRELVKEWFTIK